MKKVVFGLLLCAVASMSGCTTATYGKKFSCVSAQPDRYSIKIYTGGFAGTGTATERVKEEADEFLFQNPEYSSYEIVSKKFEPIPSGTRFIVEFKK